MSVSVSAGSADSVGSDLAGLAADLVAKDDSLWGPEAQPEASVRLGWLDLPTSSEALLPQLREIRDRLSAKGLDHVVLAGMGGSSLAPEVITRTAGADLTILDSTDPHQVGAALRDRIDRTVVVVASKSGGTVETDSHRRAYEQAFRDAGLTDAEVAERIVVVTDPGSPLHDAAVEAGYSVVLADPDVGGRYSALSAFGLTPSFLAGADVERLLADARVLAGDLGEDGNPGMVLGAALGQSAKSGRDKLVIADAGSGMVGFGDWAEQLVAESTGKQGTGILPVVVEGIDAPGFADAGSDAYRVLLGPGRPGVDAAAVSGSLGAQFLLWEYATAVAGKILGINPFDQPNVAESKENTATLLEESGDGPAAGGRAGARRRGRRGARRPDGPGLSHRPRRGSPRTGRRHRRRRVPRGDGLPRPPRRQRRRGGPAAAGPGRGRATGHLRVGAPLPALHRPVPQGRPAGRRVPAGHRGRHP